MFLRMVALSLVLVLGRGLFAQENQLITSLATSRVTLDENWLVYSTLESFERKDLNGDGDLSDSVIQLRDLATGERTNLRLAGDSLALSENWLVFRVSEDGQSEDLNGDGDLSDSVIHLRDLATGEMTNLELAVYHRGVALSENWLVINVPEDRQSEDLNGDGDTEDEVLYTVDLSRIPSRFRRGDCTGDGNVDIADATCALNWLFAEAPVPGCLAALNTNGDNTVDLADPVFLLNFLFAGGPAPVDPFPDCGPGMLPADAELGCETSCQ